MAAERDASQDDHPDPAGWRWALVGSGALLAVVLVCGLAGSIKQASQDDSALAQGLEPMQSPHPVRGGGSTPLSAVDGMRSVYVPGGNFEFGSDQGEALARASFLLL